MAFNSAFKGLMKILPVEAELFHADGQTDMMKPIVALRGSGNKPKSKNIIR